MTTTLTDPHVGALTDADVVSRPLLGGAVSDTAALVARSLRQVLRNGEVLVMSVALPVMLLLLFVYVFGGAMQTGTSYVTYVVPGIVLLTASFGSAATAVSVCADKVTGIVERFRSMDMHASAVLTGHVAASLLRNLFAAAVVFGVALVMGFRPTASTLDWLAVTGLLSLFILGISWVCACLGLVAGSVDAANGYTFGFLFLPYVSSAFVPVDSMPSWLRGFAEHQPVTPMIEAVRGLLTGTPVGSAWWQAVLWWGGIGLVAYIGAGLLFRRTAA